MNDLEISKKLALAIGWPSKYVVVKDGKVSIFRGTTLWDWATFDYQDWNVIGPIAVKYDCFPIRTVNGAWVQHQGGCLQETPQKAIAMAVINKAATAAVGSYTFDAKLTGYEQITVKARNLEEAEEKVAERMEEIYRKAPAWDLRTKSIEYQRLGKG